MAEPPKDRRPNKVTGNADPRVGGHDQLRDSPDGIERGKGPSDLDMRQPNERDEAAEPDASGPRTVGKQAADDLAAGREDTGRRSAGTGDVEPGDRASAPNTSNRKDKP